MTSITPYSLYLHIPFCTHRCAYCDFNTYAGLEHLIGPYTEALCKEIRGLGAAKRLPVHTVFLGGGTPSLLSTQGLAQILEAIRETFDPDPTIEITMEANPGTLTREYVEEMANLGINRLSLGMQSANPNDLRILERQHDLNDVVQSVKWAEQAGLLNINLDLIFGLPDQTLRSWQGTLAMALSLRPAHLSLYCLTIEHGTPLKKWIDRGLLVEPDEDIAAEMYEFSIDYLYNNGYAQYEISNWARKDTNGQISYCKHNLQYWRTQPWLGVGAGAHGFVANESGTTYVRTVNVLSPAQYVHKMMNSSIGLEFPRTPATSSLESVTSETLMGDFMMMGLRLVEEGVSDKEFSNRFGFSIDQRYHRKIRRLLNLNLIEWSGTDRLRLTSKGRLLGNRVFREFVE
jgi:oxygen-independent coproporphyrinogen-3 oxidase